MDKNNSRSGHLLLPRRSFIKGAASVSLMALMRQRALAQEGSPPMRLVLWFVPEGTESEFFWPKETGALSINMESNLAGTEAPNIDTHENWILQPLKDFESRMTLLRGVKNHWDASEQRRHPEYHQAAMEGLLTGFGGNSLDVIFGRENQGNAPFSSLQMGTLGWTQQANAADRMLFMRDGNQVEANWSPADVYNTVFPGSGSGRDENAQARAQLQSRLALMGSVKEELNAIECAGGVDARRRLDAYLSSIESLENQSRVLFDELEVPASEGGKPDIEIPEGADQTSFYQQESRFPETGKLMMDVAVASLAMDRTRCLGLQWSASGFNTHNAYDFITEETSGAGDYPLAQGLDPATNTLYQEGVAQRDRARIFRWYNEQLAYFLGQLANTPEGDGSMLDNTIVATISEAGGMFNDIEDLPLMIFSPSNTSLNRGSYIRTDIQRNHPDYLLSLARAAGSSIDSVGVGTQVIAELGDI